MEGERGVLQQGVQRTALKGSRIQPLERIGGEDGEGQEQHAEQTLGRHGRSLEAERQAPGAGQDCPEAGQHQTPQDQRALVAAPGGGDLVEHRLVGVAVGRDIGDREVRDREGQDQGGESQGDNARAGQGRALGRAGQHRAAAQTTGRSHAGLQHREHQGEDQGESAQFNNHRSAAPAAGVSPPGRHSPLAFRRSATSRGI